MLRNFQIIPHSEMSECEDYLLSCFGGLGCRACITENDQAGGFVLFSCFALVEVSVYPLT